MFDESTESSSTLVWILVPGRCEGVGRAPASDFASMAGLAQRLRKSGRSVAAARSTTDCGISTSANRGDYRGSQPAGLRYHYKIVMNGKTNFLDCRPTKEQ